MHRLSSLKTTLLISILITYISASNSFPLGIHLGPKYITAALTHANGSTSPIAHIKGSTAYQFILAPPDAATPPNTALVPKILRTTFNGIKSSADITLGEKIREVVITLPNYIETEILEAITRAAKLASFDVLDALKFTDAVGVAYDLLAGSNGDGDGLSSVSVLVEYNESGLEIWIMDDAWVLKPKGHIMFPELGVEAIVDEAADTYFLTVQRRLEASLREFLVKEDGEAVVGLRGVVLAGDASEKGMRGMRGVLELVLGDLGYGDVKGMVRDEIEGLYVGAVGAARRGREMRMFQERFEGRERGRGHEEL